MNSKFGVIEPETKTLLQLLGKLLRKNDVAVDPVCRNGGSVSGGQYQSRGGRKLGNHPAPKSETLDDKVVLL